MENVIQGANQDTANTRQPGGGLQHEGRRSIKTGLKTDEIGKGKYYELEGTHLREQFGMEVKKYYELEGWKVKCILQYFSVHVPPRSIKALKNQSEMLNGTIISP